MFNSRMKTRRTLPRAGVVQRHTGAAPAEMRAQQRALVHPLVRDEENARLYRYEEQIKAQFARIEPTLRRMASLQHQVDFIEQAQRLVGDSFGFDVPPALLEDSWIRGLDFGRLYAWCVFETFRHMSDEFFHTQPLHLGDEQTFQSFLEKCGIHAVDISSCADGRLAHVISYVLRLPHKLVRRKSYAGALFDVEDSLQKWVETEMLRYREQLPNPAGNNTRYLKIAVYHYSSAHPDSEGCAAHGSDVQRAAEAAMHRLYAFRQAVENSFCCGASIDLLLIGVDTDTDAIRLHVPSQDGVLDSTVFVDGMQLYAATRGELLANGQELVRQITVKHFRDAAIGELDAGLLEISAYLLVNNLSQIDYVRRYHDGSYRDVGHQEHFIGMGVGFEEIQLRNLTYFAYLKTVEEATTDLDVGMKIFKKLNADRGLPVPVVIRYDYHGEVPEARQRAVARCRKLDSALRQRYAGLVEKSLLHTLLMVRDCHTDQRAEVIACSVPFIDQEMPS